MLIGIVAFGTCGYYWVEHMPFFEAFYMTIITISTVGYAEIVPLSQAGRALTIIIIILGITVGAYTIGLLVRAFVEGELAKIVGRRIVQKQISSLKDHFIVCGYGRIGRIMCSEFAADNIDFVVIEQDPATREEIENQRYLCIEMDATSEEALLAAGIMNAKGIATAVNSDANNVFITMTAKSRNSDNLFNPILQERVPGLYHSMGQTAEMVARRYNVTREQQDQYSLQSQQRTAAAQRSCPPTGRRTSLAVPCFAARDTRRTTSSRPDADRSRSVGCRSRGGRCPVPGSASADRPVRGRRTIRRRPAARCRWRSRRWRPARCRGPECGRRGSRCPARTGRSCPGIGRGQCPRW